MKPIQQAEYAAAFDIPAKMTAAPIMAAKLINAGQVDLVKEVCEGDVITLALLLARWRKLLDAGRHRCRRGLHPALDRGRTA